MKKLPILLLMLISSYCYGQWMDVGGGVYYSQSPYSGVLSMIVYNDKLWITGGFEIAGSDSSVLDIATWDGHQLEGISPGNDGGGSIYDLEVFTDGKLYIGGDFEPTASFNSGNGISRWSIDSWENFTYGVPLATNPGIFSLCTFHNKLYAAGNFTQICNTSTDCINVKDIASWDGDSWDNVAGGPGGFEIAATAVYNDELIVCGRIDKMPYYYHIARWNDTSWRSLGRFGLLGNNVYSLTVDTLRNLLYVAGNFYWADGETGYNIAQWDGRQWEFINQTQFSGGRPSVGMYHNDLYFCSIDPIVLPNGDTVSGIMKWNGKEWEGVGARFTTWDSLTGSVGRVIEYHDTLYFGGNIDFLNDTIPVNNIIRMYAPADTGCENLLGNYNKIWAQDTTYFCDQVRVAFDNNTLYYADHWLWNFGDGATDTVPAPQYVFDSAGQYNVSLITTYKNCIDTTFKTITALPCDSLHVNISGHPDTMTMALDQYNHWLVWVTFSVTANSTMADFTYYWDFGEGHQDSGYYADQDGLIINPYVWYYDEAGTYIIRLVVKQDCCYDTIYDTITILDPSGIGEIQKGQGYLGQNIPNPFKNNTTIPYNVPPGSTGSIFIVDMNGKLIEKFELDSDKSQLEISLKQYRSGVYFYSIKIDGQVKQTRQMILIE